ncbi:hypothetical protein [Massilia sp. Dwa41.01b]|uniref:hypothetical protein n=1 Tax=Massilia sp. Dwa41.01b TaxID=2709302 RepID=UPI001E5C72B9|nr:hypothetical protein [Massilia sp. Dwa41.01b]
MEKLIHELMRLYFPAGLSAALLGPRIAGAHGEPLALHEADRTRAIVLPFARNRADDRAGDAGAHWRRLCEAANLLQARYDFPAPAVSISANGGFRLWLSLAAPVTLEAAQAFLEGLRDSVLPDRRRARRRRRAGRTAALPEHGERALGRLYPSRHGRFLHRRHGTGDGAAPKRAGRFPEGLECIAPAQFEGALRARGRPSRRRARRSRRPRPSRRRPLLGASPNDSLLLRDATLEDIVRHLHARGIEPTFRHLLPLESVRH